MILKRFTMALGLLLTATVVCTLVGYAVLARPAHAGPAEPTVESSIVLRVEFPDIWPWSRPDGQVAWTFRLWGGAGS